MNIVIKHSNKPRRLLAWTIAAGFALVLTIGQPAISQWLGVGEVPVASACQSQSGHGDC